MLLFKAHMSSASTAAAPSEQTSSTYLRAAAFPLVALGLLALAAEPSVAGELHQSGAIPQFELAENQEEFFSNVVRYGRYFVTVMLGTGYVILRPIANMFKNPLTGILAIILVGGSIVGTKVTLDAMLGLSDQVNMASDGFM